ncbi:MAG: hypothetical protein KKG00_17215, partial [Bacteroidetes bacterium]|nr:hypothetical protein [Bacteroidota bacterium]
MSQFYSFFVDVDHYEDVIKGTKVAKLITQPNSFEFMYYTVIDLPWPASNRDLTVQANIDVDKGNDKMTIQAENKEGVKPKNSSLVRVPYWRAEWRIRQKENNYLDIEYFFKVDPGGNLPAWIVNET